MRVFALRLLFWSLGVIPSGIVLAVNTCDFGALIPTHGTPSVQRLITLKEKSPEGYRKLVARKPAYDLLVKDAEIDALFKQGLSQQQIILKLAPDDYDQGVKEISAYLRRKNWREKYMGDPRPLPSYPGGPRLTDVDRFSEEVHLPPIHKKGVKRSQVKIQNKDYEIFYEPDSDVINVYDSTGARVGHFEFTIYEYGSFESLKIKMVAIDASEKGQGLSGILYDYALKNLPPNLKHIEGNLAYDNAKIFWKEFQKSGDYYQSVRATPGYKQRAKQGYSKIEPPPEDWLPSEFNERNQVPLVTSRP